MKNFFCFSYVTLIAATLASPAAAPLCSFGIVASVYTPSLTNINVGDQVMWNWSGLNHSTTVIRMPLDLAFAIHLIVHHQFIPAHLSLSVARFTERLLNASSIIVTCTNFPPIVLSPMTPHGHGLFPRLPMSTSKRRYRTGYGNRDQVQVLLVAHLV